MYELNDTIVAVSSPSSSQRAIVRITGSGTIGIAHQIFTPKIAGDRQAIFEGKLKIDDELELDGRLYLFVAPNSYTGETVAEIHFESNSSVTEALMGNLLSKGLRVAGPGEFTARAYLNGKIDLSQAEAVNEIIISSNRFQLQAAERLLAGKLAQTTGEICGELMDCLSLMEAGLDFSEDEIEFMSNTQAQERLGGIKERLAGLLSDSINCEEVIDLPSIGIAGAPNAGKSSLLNKLLGHERSIVSDEMKTTRDVLSGEVTLANCHCVLFDCAGLIDEPKTIIDQLTQQAAIEAIHNSLLVVFCVDVSKDEFAEDIAIRKLVESGNVIAVATKSDLLSKDELAGRLKEMDKVFSAGFEAISTETGDGIDRLKEMIDRKVIELSGGEAVFSESALPAGPGLTARHKQAVTNAIENITDAIEEIKTSNNEAAAMMIRGAYSDLCDVSQESIDEQILGNIFGKFCIGK